MTKGKKSKPKRYDTDHMMKNLWLKLVRDFRTVQGHTYHQREEAVLHAGIPEFREVVWPGRFKADPLLFKQEVQLENLFKRYRFKNDQYTDQQLKELTFTKFRALQERLATVHRETIPQRCYLVLQRARAIVKSIIGSCPPDVEQMGRFSTRATVGCPARDSYLDHKLAGPITATPDHLRWFKSYLDSDVLLDQTLQQCSPPGGPLWEGDVDSLPLIGVPKSYKSERLIQPNTLIGSLYTDIVGKLIQECLKQNAGLDITKLQDRHRVLAQKYSRSRKYATVDMSSASESYQWWLLCMLLPRKWLKVITLGRAKYYLHNQKKMYYQSFMAMGIGFTFPLQTLLFYALVRSVRELLGLCSKNDFESVYGDDLIYDARIHPYVVEIFTHIGFKINTEKSFVKTHFRESCGGDYYHGVDVRPFSPEGGHQLLTPRRYEAWLYKIYNGLTLRWPPEVIPQTLHYLRTELLRVAPLIKQVPPNYPDTSGVRVDSPIDRHSAEVMAGFSPVFALFYEGSCWYEFDHLVETPRHRFVSFQLPYYWNKLRMMAEGEEYVPHVAYASQTEEIEWVKAKRQPRNYRDRERRRLVKLQPVTSCKLTVGKIQSNLGLVSDWTYERLALKTT